MIGHRIFLKFAGLFSRVFSTKFNPFYHLGTLAIYFFTLAFISGIYLFFFYTVDPTQAYNSTLALTEQFFGNLMRNIHRYTSDLFVVFVFMHFLHMLITGKFKRIKSWIFGIVSLVITLFIGLTGFVLVWDQKAKLLGVLTAKLLIYLPFFDPSIAGAFLINDLAYLGGIFRVTLFGHIFFCAFTALFLWLHETHLSKPGVFPPKVVMIWAGIFTLLISLLFNADIDSPAQNSVLPVDTGFNWYYFFGYYFLKTFSVGWNWIFILIGLLVFFSFPFLFKKDKKIIPVINKDLCDGCKQCADDCPYESISLIAIAEGVEKAQINTDKCVGCNICVGSCKSSAISSEKVNAGLINSIKGKNHIVTCSSLIKDVKISKIENTDITEVICLGDIHAKSLDISTISGNNKLILVGCESCFYRFGAEWAKERISHKRRPVIKSGANYSNMLFVTSGKNISKEIEAFVNTESERTKRDIMICDYKKPNYIIAMIISLVLFLTIPWLSNQKMSFYSSKDRTLILNMKYTSTPLHKQERSSSHLSHMQADIAVSVGRSDIKVDVIDLGSGKIMFSKIYEPRGIRKDIAIYVYEEVAVAENIMVKMSEVSFPDKEFRVDEIKLNEGESRVLRFINGKLEL